MPNRLSVSVVIPTYNRAKLVTRAVESALRAVEPDDEILVVDDGSTDDTAAVVSRYGAPVRFVAAPHGGAGATRNRGLAEARNPLVAFLDSDDAWMPDKLRIQRALMEARPDVAFCFSDFQVRNDMTGEMYAGGIKAWVHADMPWDTLIGPGQPFSAIAGLPPGRRDFTVRIGDLYPALVEYGCVAMFTTMLRRDLPGGLPRFPTDLPTFEDWQFAGELARRGPAAYLDCDTATQHGHASPRLTDANLLVRAQTRVAILERVWGRDPAFLDRHRGWYDRIVAAQQQDINLVTAIGLLRRGKIREARAAFARCAAIPARYRCLVWLPGVVVRTLYKLTAPFGDG